MVLLFSTFDIIIRMVAWIRRFIFNCRSSSNRKNAELSYEECKEAEKNIIEFVQDETLLSEVEKRLKSFR